MQVVAIALNTLGTAVVRALSNRESVEVGHKKPIDKKRYQDPRDVDVSVSEISRRGLVVLFDHSLAQ